MGVMTAQIPWAAPHGAKVLIQWLTPLGEVRQSRPSGAILPYRRVMRIGGSADQLCDNGLYSVSTFAGDEAQCADEAQKTHNRILLMAGHFTSQAKITMPDGSVVQVDDVRVMELPIPVDYGDDTPWFRQTGTYHIDLRIVATS